MKRNHLELFFEKNCPVCEEVLQTLHLFARHHGLEFHTYDRDRESKAFRERRVFICPATFLNGCLVFYGTVSTEVLQTKLTTF